MDVTPEVELNGVDSGNWVEAELDVTTLATSTPPTGRNSVSGSLTFKGRAEQVVGWYSGESTGNEPHLVVQYTGP